MPTKRAATVNTRMTNMSLRLDDALRERITTVAALMGERAGAGGPLPESLTVRAALERGLAAIEDELRGKKRA
jgi:hypothetical protein